MKLDKAIVALCACYLAALPLGLPHLMFVIGFVFLVLKATSGKVSINILWLFLFVAFGVMQMIIGGDWKGMVNNVSSMMMFPITYEILRNKTKERLIELSIAFVKTTVILMCFEAVIRYPFATIMPLGEGLYRYKFHSFMFQDTNFAGLVLLVVVFFIRYLKIFYNVNLKKYYWIGVVLLFLTVSRAAMLAYIVGEIMSFKIQPDKYIKQVSFRFILMIIIGTVAGTAIFLWLYEDPSFKSKLYILEIAEKTYDDLGVIKYIGAGYNKSEELLGIYAHNVIFLYFIETGIVGCVLKLVFLLYIMIKSKWRGLIVFFPMFIAAQSAIGYGIHYLYVILALISVLTFKTYEKNFIYHN